MEAYILEHYRKTGTFTYAGCYGNYFRSLPDDIAVLGRLICSQIIHRVTLKEGNTNANATLLYGDMNRYPWYRMRCEDDVLLTAPALTAELFRLDERGFVKDRKVEHKIVVTCRYVSVLMSAILKAKGIPARSRAGFAPYFQEGVSMDHWIPSGNFCKLCKHQLINGVKNAFETDKTHNQTQKPVQSSNSQMRFISRERG